MSLWFRLVPKLAPKGLGDFFHGILHESHGSAHWVWADGFGSVSLPSVEMNLGLLLPRHPCRTRFSEPTFRFCQSKPSVPYIPLPGWAWETLSKGASANLKAKQIKSPKTQPPPPPPEPCDVRPDLRGFSELFPDLLGKGSGARVTRRRGCEL